MQSKAEEAIKQKNKKKKIGKKEKEKEKAGGHFEFR